MAITWNETQTIIPSYDREIIAKNPNKPVLCNSAVKKCKIMKFQRNFSEQKILETMMDDELLLWSYT